MHLRVTFAFVCFAAFAASGGDDVLQRGSPQYYNPWFTSANTKYRLSLRLRPDIPDFSEVRVDEYDAVPHEKPKTNVAAFYAITDGGRQLISTWDAPWNTERVLLSDRGDRVIPVTFSTNSAHRIDATPLFSIYDTNGLLVRTFPPADLFTADELAAYHRDWAFLTVTLEGDVLKVVLREKRTIRIRIADGGLV
jgi:hypothetical protein